MKKAQDLIRLRSTIREGESESAFVYRLSQDAARKARRVYRELHPRPLFKGGRPSLKAKVDAAADMVWTKWGRKFPARRSTFDALLQEVRKQIGHTASDTRTVTRHLHEWLDCNLSVLDFPASFLKRPAYEEIVRGRVLMGALGATGVFRAAFNAMRAAGLAEPPNEPKLRAKVMKHFDGRTLEQFNVMRDAILKLDRKTLAGRIISSRAAK